MKFKCSSFAYFYIKVDECTGVTFVFLSQNVPSCQGAEWFLLLSEFRTESLHFQELVPLLHGYLQGQVVAPLVWIRGERCRFYAHCRLYFSPYGMLKHFEAGQFGGIKMRF